MSIEMHTLKVRLTFQEEVLGTASNNPDIHSEYIASKAPDAMSAEEEVAAIGVEEAVEKSMTVFPRNDNGEPILFDYQIKGFFKDACGVLFTAASVKLSGESSPIRISSGRRVCVKRLFNCSPIYFSPLYAARATEIFFFVPIL